VECFEYLVSKTTNDAKYKRGIKSRTVTAKAAFNKKKSLFSSKSDLSLRKNPVKCYIWSIALCGAVTWKLWKIEQKYLESSEMRFRKRMEKISWTNRVRKEVLQRDK
jgi:hypothetical protein